jgi:hypothetical protein
MSKGQNILKDIFVTGSDEIAQGQIINAWHVSQSVVALTGAENYDISVSGSFTVSGSIYQENYTNAPSPLGSVHNIVVRSATSGEYMLWPVLQAPLVHQALQALLVHPDLVHQVLQVLQVQVLLVLPASQA